MTSNASDESSGQNTLLEKMMARAIPDMPLEMVDHRPAQKLLDGVQIRDLTTHTDQRGSVFEMFDTRWEWHPDLINFAYCFTVRPGIVKGWGLHCKHEDRYCLIQGEIDLILFDPRAESSTFGEVCRIQMSSYHRKLVSIPKFVWHADHNVGSSDAVVVNFPTQPYDHANPDKWRLPIDTDLIPYSFGHASGG